MRTFNQLGKKYAFSPLFYTLSIIFFPQPVIWPYFIYGGGGCKKKNINPSRDFKHFFFFFFFHLNFFWGLFGTLWNRFWKFWVKFDWNSTKEGRPKFDKLKVRRSILIVKYIRKYMKYYLGVNTKFVFGLPRASRFGAGKKEN